MHMHKRIGILGGMSPESTTAYYEYITRSYTQRFGDYTYPEIIIYSVSFQYYVDWPMAERWDKVTDGLVKAARKLEAAGADFIIIATNTMHLVFDQVQENVNIPMISMLEAVGEAILEQSIKKVGLLGTKFTMEKTFYHEALAKKGITIEVPNAEDRKYVNDVIYNELVAGEINSSSRNGYVEIINKLKSSGAQGVILGCTEIPLLVSEADVGMPLFDTTVIHSEAALDFALVT
jgi:aspartate racemase